MAYKSKRKLKKDIQALKFIIEMQAVLIDSSLKIAKELAIEIKKEEELEERMNKFDKSLGKVRGDMHREKEFYKKTPTPKKYDYVSRNLWHDLP